MKQNIFMVYIMKNLEQQSAFTQQMNRIQEYFMMYYILYGKEFLKLYI